MRFSDYTEPPVKVYGRPFEATVTKRNTPNPSLRVFLSRGTADASKINNHELCSTTEFSSISDLLLVKNKL